MRTGAEADMEALRQLQAWLDAAPLRTASLALRANARELRGVWPCAVVLQVQGAAGSGEGESERTESHISITGEAPSIARAWALVSDQLRTVAR